MMVSDERYMRRAAEGMLRAMEHYGDRYPTVGDGRVGSPQWYVSMLGKVSLMRGDALPEVEGVTWHGLRWKRYAEMLLSELDGRV